MFGVFAAVGQCMITGFISTVHTVLHRSASRDTGSVTSLTGCPVYRVVMLGGQGVGKSAICSQFLSSDHVNTYENVGRREDFFLSLWVSIKDHIAEDSVEKDVGLSVDGRESHLVFIDHGHGTMKLENLLLTYSPQAVLVVMAVDNMESFQLAEHILVYLTHNGYIEDKVI